MLILHHIALVLQNVHFSVSRVQFSLLPFLLKVKHTIWAYIVHPDSQGSYPPILRMPDSALASVSPQMASIHGFRTMGA